MHHLSKILKCTKIRVEFFYDSLAKEEMKPLMDVDRHTAADIRNWRTKDEAIRQAEAKAEDVDWIISLKDYTDEFEEYLSIFKPFGYHWKFDWDRYLSIVKKKYRDFLIEMWVDGDNLKIIK